LLDADKVVGDEVDKQGRAAHVRFILIFGCA